MILTRHINKSDAWLLSLCFYSSAFENINLEKKSSKYRDTIANEKFEVFVFLDLMLLGPAIVLVVAYSKCMGKSYILEIQIFLLSPGIYVAIAWHCFLSPPNERNIVEQAFCCLTQIVPEMSPDEEFSFC